ncbi:MAG: class I SAM-dependent methyltransferase [Alphaproteobacteria bacterium]|nr:class I SAM-dependent methyltransferase [Alphaproteobacteria bacterium]
MDRKAIREGMQAVYERQAAHFDAERNKSGLEAAWLARFAEHLPAGASVLDAGCGTGDPVSRWFIERGYALTGVDYAAPMIAIAAERFPTARWRVADMRVLDLEESFDAVLSWHGFFHLSPAEQRIGLERLCAHLKPGGPLMLTVGPRAGEAIGHVGGEPVYHASFSKESYADKLDALGVELEAFVISDPEAGGASVLLARKRA